MNDLRAVCLCTQTINRHSYEQRKLGKNILRVSRTFQKLSACGLFAVQPALLLRLCGVLLTLTLMLLQLVLL
ncbi:unnamed protein product [Plutella xylostella]|uniref:(diamondback moth) hypothetical protein n=1 Tax=Plutella xylostella TaxID=51655 RepID=A0A8S4G4Z3_PLUXY|nr:unnamed protein product [Plutella xylostella]